MITKQTTSQQDRDKRELPQLGKKSAKIHNNFIFNSEKLNASH